MTFDSRTGERLHDLQLVCPRLIGPLSWLLGTYHAVWTSFDLDEPGPPRYGFWTKSEWM